MGSVIKSLLSKIFPPSQVRGLMLGLDASGRTTALYKLKLGEVVTTIPTIGFNVESVDYKGIEFTLWDVGGCDKIRPLWRHYYQNTSVVMFFIDSNDRSRLEEIVNEINITLREEELKHIPLLILANKQDLPNCMSVSEIKSHVDKLNITDRQVLVIGTVATTGEGLYEGLDWLSDQIRHTKRPEMKQPEPKQDDQKTLLEKWLEVEDEPDEEFLKKFLDYKLDSWDHRTHLRIAWVYLKKHGRKEGMKLIFDGIRNFILNSERAKKTTFHETMTYFWVHMVHYAMEATQNPTGDFKGFLLMNPQLSNGGMYLEYYNKDTMMNPDAKANVVLPDKKALPSMINKQWRAKKEDVDDVFLQQFETLALDQWNHESLLRMIYLYLSKEGRRIGAKKVFEGVEKVAKSSYHTTKTYFWIQMVDLALNSMKTKPESFKEFLAANPHLNSEKLILHYYKEGTLYSPQAAKEMVLPDKLKFTDVIKQ